MMRKLTWAAILSFLFLLLSFLNASQIVENVAEYSFSVEKLKTRLYDFSSNASVDRWAYGYDNASLPPSQPDIPSIEFNSLQYFNVSYNDDVYQVDAGSNGEYACHRFVFTIYESNISKINIFWRGAGICLLVWGGNYYIVPSRSGAKLYAWNYSSSHYDEITNTASYNVVNLSANLSLHYVGIDGKVILLVEQTSKTMLLWLFNLFSVIATDYVSVEVEYA